MVNESPTLLPGEQPLATTSPPDEQSLATEIRPVTLTPPQFIKAEANLLRFPIFALQTKGLRTFDGIECRGTKTENGATHQFVFRVTRNTDHLYPGPLSRKAHFAILNILNEQGFPFQNPVTWSWRELAARMGISYAGAHTTAKLKRAIQSTHGIVITSEFALKSGADRQSLPNRSHGYHLYEDYVFVHESLPDGTIADRNHLWLSDWYLGNLNGLYSAPINYPLWRTLNDASPIASRLYEFLLFNFAGGFPHFTINYAKLAEFLPVRVEAYAAHAHKQLDPAVTVLRTHHVVQDVTWRTGQGGALQLRIAPGPLLRGTAASRLGSASDQHLIDDLTVHELRNNQSPAWLTVTEFHRVWRGDEHHRPTPAELDAARELLDEYGREKLFAMLPKVVRALKAEFPTAKTFGAARVYFRDIGERDKRRSTAAEQEQCDEPEPTADDRQAATQQERLPNLRAIWATLPAAERSDIERTVLARQPAAIKKFPKTIERFCLRELEHRRANPQSP